MQKNILVLNDLHVGSRYGLLPPDFMDTAGTVHSQNVGQVYLWDRFTATLNKIHNIDVIVINGDLLDGMQPKSKGIPLTLHRIEDQREAAIKVLEQVRDTFPKAKWYFVEGTPYHETGEQVAQVAYNLLGSAHKVDQSLKLAVGDAVIQFHHEGAWAGGYAKAGALEKTLIHSWLAEATDGHEAAHCQVRAHCHYFCFTGRKDRLAIVAPCWQLQTEYMTRRSPNANIPDIGCIVLHVDDSLVKNGSCPVGFTPYVCKHPRPAIEALVEEENYVNEIAAAL